MIRECPRKMTWVERARQLGVEAQHLHYGIRNLDKQRRVGAQIYLLERKLEEIEGVNRASSDSE